MADPRHGSPRAAEVACDLVARCRSILRRRRDMDDMSRRRRPCRARMKLRRFLRGHGRDYSALTHRLQQPPTIERSTPEINRHLIASPYRALAQTCCGGRSAAKPWERSKGSARATQGRPHVSILRLHQPVALPLPRGSATGQVALHGAWSGFSRRIDAEMLRTVAARSGTPSTSFVCGPTAFVERTADLLISLGHEPAKIRTAIRATGG